VYLTLAVWVSADIFASGRLAEMMSLTVPSTGLSNIVTVSGLASMIIAIRRVREPFDPSPVHSIVATARVSAPLMDEAETARGINGIVAAGGGTVGMVTGYRAGARSGATVDVAAVMRGTVDLRPLGRPLAAPDDTLSIMRSAVIITKLLVATVENLTPMAGAKAQVQNTAFCLVVEVLGGFRAVPSLASPVVLFADACSILAPRDPASGLCARRLVAAMLPAAGQPVGLGLIALRHLASVIRAVASSCFALAFTTLVRTPVFRTAGQPAGLGFMALWHLASVPRAVASSYFALVFTALVRTLVFLAVEPRPPLTATDGALMNLAILPQFPLVLAGLGLTSMILAIATRFAQRLAAFPMPGNE